LIFSQRTRKSRTRWLKFQRTSRNRVTFQGKRCKGMRSKMLTECSILRPSIRLIGPLPAAGTFRTAASCMKRRSRMNSVIDARNSVAYLLD
jgi:hypothetical protein